MLIAALVLAGCATTRVDWNTRIGQYTFDQAVIELGPPDKQAKLSDGQTIAEWVSRHRAASSISIGTGYSRYPGGIGMVQTITPSEYETKLRLTFNTNNVLAAWVKK